MDLVVASFQFSAIIDIGRADTEDCGSIRHIGTVTNVEPIASRDGSSEGSKVLIRATPPQLR